MVVRDSVLLFWEGETDKVHLNSRVKGNRERDTAWKGNHFS